MRAVLLLGIVTGLAMAVYFSVLSVESPLAWDFIAYVEAAEAVLEGESFVGYEPIEAGGEYVYPPIVIFAFIPYAFIGDWEVAFIIHSIVNLGALAILAALTISELRRLDVSLERLDRALIVAFFLVSLYPLVNIGLGQIDPVIALLIAFVFIGSEAGHDRLTGGALSIAAIVKLFPLSFGLWLLFQRRFKSILFAAILFVAGVISSLIIFGIGTNRTYLEVIILERSRLRAFADGMVSPDFFSVTLIRPISAIFPMIPPILYLGISLAVVLPIIAYSYRRTLSHRDRHMAFLLTVLGLLIALPSSNLNHLLYIYMPVIVLLFSLTSGRARRWLAIGLGIILVPLQPAIIKGLLELTPMPTATVEMIHQIVYMLLSVISVALIGTIVILAAGVYYHRRTATDLSRSTEGGDEIAQRLFGVVGLRDRTRQ